MAGSKIESIGGSTVGDKKFEKLTVPEMTVLLNVLGYNIGEGGLLIDKKTKEFHKCPITNENVFIEDASVLPGSTLVIKTSELSLAEYFTEYLEKNSE